MRGATRAAVRVELRREEVGRVRLVPDRVEADRRKPDEAARVALGQRVREVAQVARIGRRDVRRRAAVGPGRRAPDRQQHLDPALLGAPHELVEIAEPVLAAQTGRRGGAGARCDLRPVDERANDGSRRRLRRGRGSRARLACQRNAWSSKSPT